MFQMLICNIPKPWVTGNFEGLVALGCPKPLLVHMKQFVWLLLMGIVTKESAEILKVTAGQRKGQKAEKMKLIS